jgi:hypothetical protein
MSIQFDAHALEIPCPQCGQKHKKTVGWLKSHQDIACGCGGTIAVDSRDLHRKLADVEKQLKDITRNFRL